MIFCEHCFVDREISEMIRTAAKADNRKGKCDLCGSDDVYLYDTDKQDLLTPYFESLLSIYSPASNLPDNYPHAERTTLIDDLKSRWKIFSPDLSNSDIGKIIQSICQNSFDVDFLLEGLVGIPGLYDKEYLEQYSLIRNSEWKEFAHELKTVNRYHSKLMNFETLDRFCAAMMKEYKEGQEFYRARISESPKGYPLDQMSAPPEGKSSEGRANARGITCLYLANNIETALHEVRAMAFDYVTVAKMRLKKDIVLVNLRDINRISPFSDNIDPLDYAVNAKYLNQINDEMGKALRRNDSTLDYVPTQYIADYIKSIEDSQGNHLYSGIEYNSTTNPKGFNLAIYDPDLFECESADVYEIGKLQYDYNLIASE